MFRFSIEARPSALTFLQWAIGVEFFPAILRQVLRQVALQHSVNMDDSDDKCQVIDCVSFIDP